MIIRYFYDLKLAQASYLVGCGATGQAIVIDPLRDIKAYLHMADDLGLTITAVTETHIHADYLSGTRELSAATGAVMYLSDEGGEDWKYEFVADPLVKLVRDGDVIRIGNLSLKVMHTPGHTPEHIVFVLTDHPASELPHSIFTGDFIFVGDVGRPDLLERAASFEGTMVKGARTLFQSLRRLDEFPDSLLLWPAHGAGSACGKSLGGSPVSSLGYERRTNWALLMTSEDKFVDEVLSGQPEPPVYFKEMKFRNKQGPAILGSMPRVSQVALPGDLPIVDVRDGDTVRSGFLPGSIVIPSGGGLTNWSGWMLPYDRPVVLLADSQQQADTAARDMATVGLDIVQGWLHPSAFPAASFRPIPAVPTSELTADDVVLDIRGINEWREVRLGRASHIPLGYLRSRVAELPRDKRIVVHCASGGRAPTGISVLAQEGFNRVAELAGGFDALERDLASELVRA
ncbi:MAG: Hydroxyacylglutathione hydrolase [Fimbriimonadaceae bacterium]|nr:Hydroxyacylglutathione hydrolase [Fimbriimonadaceae bacterium]